MKASILFFKISALILLLSACQPSSSTKDQHQQQLFTFGTLVDINVITADSSQAEQVINEISGEFDRLHRQWHPWKKGALAHTNQQLTNHEAFIGEPSIINLIKDSQLLSEKSNGLFNPALGHLIKLWQFDQLEDEHYQFQLPTPQAIQQTLDQKPIMKDIVIEGQQLSSNNSAVSLDFGAFAKGVAIENMMAILEKHSIKSALLNAGGDLKVLGSKNGKPWNIGIKNPANSQAPSSPSVIASIELMDNEALFTSGNYERFFEYKGQHYHHILDPRTGYPSVGTHSVTVLHEDAALADAASTALFIAGPEQWAKIAKNMGIQCVMLIADDNKIYLTSAMAKRIKLLTDTKPVIVEL